MAIVAPVAPPTVSPLPNPPSSTSPMDFDPRADAFLGALPINQSQMNSLGVNVYDNALKTYNSATDTTSAANTAASAAIVATDSATIASQSLESMQKLYLGSKSSLPSTDNQGNPLQVGTWFVNASQGYWYWWDGSNWKLGVSDLSSVDWNTQITSKPSTLPGYGIVDQPQARTDLGLKSAAVADILGLVSQTGGVPTGAIIQRGNNANGEFVRFADGTQICVTSVVSSFGTPTAIGGLFRSDNQVWNFPAAFIHLPVAYAAGHDQMTYTFTCQGAAGVSTTKYEFMFFSPTSLGVGPRRYSCTAIGRWF